MAAHSFIVRRLRTGNVADFRELNLVFGEAFGEPATYGAEPPGDAYLEELLASEDVIALIAAAEGQLVAGLIAYELKKFERERSEIYIYDLAVKEAHRRQGIATALIEHLRGIAVSRGAWTIFVQADYGDAPAIALYERLGVREEVLHFDIVIP